jgi:hypothetical protein
VEAAPPADGIEEGVKPVGGVEVLWVGQNYVLDNLGPGFDLPDNLKFFAEGVVLHGKQRDEVLVIPQCWLQRRGRERTLADIVDDPTPRPDVNKLALLGRCLQGDSHRALELGPTSPPSGIASVWVVGINV